ncbi:MAG: nylA 1 [Rhodoferax sp.]|nr:nylA 1 [Rhodoferax sp.]
MMSLDEYLQADACALAQLVRAREVSASELLELAVGRAHALQDRLGAISDFAEDLARESLRGHGATAGPFAGVPFLVKDLGAPWAGVPTRVGSRHLMQTARPDAQDGELIARFKAAGLVPFGKTAVPEFGLNLSTEPAIGPICRNPWNLQRSAGGSSGGAASAVAAGILPMAHATDAAGSIRVPAAACGLVGLKPGRGSVPQGPTYANVFGGLAAELVVSRTVRDTDMAWRVASRQGEATPSARPLRIAVLQAAPQGVPVGGEWARAAGSAAALLERQGHHVEQIDAARFSLLSERARQAYEYQSCVAAAAAVEALNPAPDGLEPMTWAVARRGRTLTLGQHATAAAALVQVTELLYRALEGFDVLLTPALARSIPEIGSMRTDGDDLDAHFHKFTELARFAVRRTPPAVQRWWCHMASMPRACRCRCNCSGCAAANQT